MNRRLLQNQITPSEPSKYNRVSGFCFHQGQTFAFVFVITLDEEKKRGGERGGHVSHQLSLLRAGCSPQPRSSLKQLSSSSRGSVCILQMMTCCSLCLLPQHLSGCTCEKHLPQHRYTVAGDPHHSPPPGAPPHITPPTEPI